MDLAHVITGSLVTEKAERLKQAGKRVYTIQVAPKATKIDVKNALKEFYDVDAKSVRIVNTGGKVRTAGRDRVIQKRDPYKKALVTLDAKSKALDLTAFKA